MLSFYEIIIKNMSFPAGRFYHFCVHMTDEVHEQWEREEARVRKQRMTPFSRINGVFWRVVGIESLVR
jgi:hypothetical protein